jgi:hypothetical protein
LARPTLEHWKAVERQAYIKEKKSHHLVYRKPRELRVIGRDANYATNPDDRKSISGSIHIVEDDHELVIEEAKVLFTLSSAESGIFPAPQSI